MRIAFLFTLCLLFSISAISQSSKVEIVKSHHSFTLLKDGDPYYFKGAGAKDHFDLLESSGANSIRIWSTNNGQLLDSAYNHGMTVSLGLYVPYTYEATHNANTTKNIFVYKAITR